MLASATSIFSPTHFHLRQLPTLLNEVEPTYGAFDAGDLGKPRMGFEYGGKTNDEGEGEWQFDVDGDGLVKIAWLRDVYGSWIDDLGTWWRVVYDNDVVLIVETKVSLMNSSGVVMKVRSLVVGVLEWGMGVA
ncbi:hypothetical protein V6N11_004727 [Hibiscus sabdariffa]|uniref:Uncharacterized protein n=1 Tax=Hibiscus sabdariffa TaxID=183260 RepID=A0ABR2SHE7_9ROSI